MSAPSVHISQDDAVVGLSPINDQREAEEFSEFLHTASLQNNSHLLLLLSQNSSITGDLEEPDPRLCFPPTIAMNSDLF